MAKGKSETPKLKVSEVSAFLEGATKASLKGTLTKLSFQKLEQIEELLEVAKELKVEARKKELQKEIDHLEAKLQQDIEARKKALEELNK